MKPLLSISRSFADRALEKRLLEDNRMQVNDIPQGASQNLIWKTIIYLKQSKGTVKKVN